MGDVDGDGRVDLQARIGDTVSGHVGVAVYASIDPGGGALDVDAPDLFVIGVGEDYAFGIGYPGPATDVDGDGLTDVYAGVLDVSAVLVTRSSGLRW